MYKKVFVDTNVLVDLFDENRPSYEYSSKLYSFLVENGYKIFTSCDIITTLYYVMVKIDKKEALLNIIKINKTLQVIEFSNKDVDNSCNLMLEDSDYKDLEDTIQYVMAKKYECDAIVSNDINFTSKDIKLFSSKEFCVELGIDI